MSYFSTFDHTMLVSVVLSGGFVALLLVSYIIQFIYGFINDDYTTMGSNYVNRIIMKFWDYSVDFEQYDYKRYYWVDECNCVHFDSGDLGVWSTFTALFFLPIFIFLLIQFYLFFAILTGACLLLVLARFCVRLSKRLAKVEGNDIRD